MRRTEPSANSTSASPLSPVMSREPPTRGMLSAASTGGSVPFSTPTVTAPERRLRRATGRCAARASAGTSRGAVAGAPARAAAAAVTLSFCWAGAACAGAGAACAGAGAACAAWSRSAPEPATCASTSTVTLAVTAVRVDFLVKRVTGSLRPCVPYSIRIPTQTPHLEKGRMGVRPCAAAANIQLRADVTG